MKKLLIPILLLLGILTTACSVNEDGKVVLTDKPIAIAGVNKNVNTSSLVTLDGTQSYSPNPAKILTYQWTLNSYPRTNFGTASLSTENESIIVLKDSNTSHPTFTATYNGVYILSLVVSDGSLESKPSDIKVNAITTVVNDKGLTYNAVVSPYTGSIWLDRNLGALKVCSSIDDELCYGDYYQWGRASDGHEKRDSNTTSTIAGSYDVGHGDFITLSTDYETWVSDNSYIDFLSYPVSDICPAGYHVANLTDFNLELTQRSSIFSSSNVDLKTLTATQAFESFLKLPLSGYKDHTEGILIDEGVVGGIWTATADLYGNPMFPSTRSDKSKALRFNDSNLSFYSKSRADGYPIRCMKYGLPDATNPLEVSNSAPIADAGTLQQTLTAEEVMLDGSNSYDPNGDSITYLWNIVQVPQEFSLELSDITSAKPTFIADVEGEYIFELTVNDGNLSSQVDQVSVNVILANIAPVADAGNNKMVITNSLVELNGTKSSDINGDLLYYMWSMTSRPEGSVSELSAPQSQFPSFIPDVDGTYIFSLVVSDGEFDSQSASVEIEASTLNIAPVAHAGGDQNANVNEEVVLDGSQSSDANADTLSYVWSIKTKPSQSNVTLKNSTLASSSFIPDVAGIYTISLKVNDGVLDSAVDNIDINVTQNSAPIAQAGLSRTVTLNETVSLDASASSDKDGSALTYLWSLVSKPQGSSASLSSITAINPTFTADTEGRYQFSLVVNDGKLNSQIDTITFITVKTLTFKGLTYKTTLSPVTGKVWLDRNLGATKVCAFTTDGACFGDHYQWGRLADGHEKFNSATTSVRADSITPNNGRYITYYNVRNDWTTADVNRTQRFAFWSNNDGSSICPQNYRVPTREELGAEMIALRDVNNQISVDDVFNSFLKIPTASYRQNGMYVNNYATLWSTTFIPNGGNYMLYVGVSKGTTFEYLTGNYITANPVRCIEDIFAPVGEDGF